MFRYGLIGNTITYGGFFGTFIYVGYEMFNIGNMAAQIPEEMAQELFDPKNLVKRPDKQSQDLKSAAAKLYLQEYSRQEYVKKREAMSGTQVSPDDLNLPDSSKPLKVQKTNEPDI